MKVLEVDLSENWEHLHEIKIEGYELIAVVIHPFYSQKSKWLFRKKQKQSRIKALFIRWKQMIS